MRSAHILFYAGGAGEARSADYNKMPRSAPLPAMHYALCTVHYNIMPRSAQVLANGS